MATTSTQNKIALTVLNAQGVTCGDCSGFEYDKLIGGKQKHGCSKESGKTKNCNGCNKFAADVRQLDSFVGTTGFDGLVNLVANIKSGKELDVLAALLRQEKKTRKAGFQFGQQVYVRYRGRSGANYLSNFMSAYVMFVDKNYMRLMGRKGGSVLTYTRNSMPDLYTPDQFAEMRADMERRGRRVDPDVQTTTSKRLRHMEEMELGITDDSLNGNVTTIDTVFRENPPEGGKRRKKNEVYGLVEIVQDLMNGYDVRKTSKSMKRKVDRPESTIVREKKGSRTDITV